MLMIASIWLVMLLEMSAGIDLSFLGVFPRRFSGLLGVLTAPFVHQDVRHAFANSVPMFVLGFLLYNAYRKVALKTVLFIWIFSGLGIWLFGRPAYHIGASGVVFGINFFIFFSGLFRMDMRSLALSLLVAFAYGSMVWGIFPMDMKVSYEAHALGALGGVIMAWIYRNVDRAPEPVWEEEEESTPAPNPEMTPGSMTHTFPATRIQVLPNSTLNLPPSEQKPGQD